MNDAGRNAGTGNGRGYGEVNAIIGVWWNVNSNAMGSTKACMTAHLADCLVQRALDGSGVTEIKFWVQRNRQSVKSAMMPRNTAESKKMESVAVVSPQKIELCDHGGGGAMTLPAH